VKLALDWKALGLDPGKTTLLAPAIDHFQQAAVFDVRSSLRVDAGRGWLLIADESPREISADAAGLDPLRGRKILAEDNTPFDLNIPANTVKTRDLPWRTGATVAVARVDPMKDNGQTWGIGLAIGWAGGRYVQINCRSDGRWELRREGRESLVEGVRSEDRSRSP